MLASDAAVALVREQLASGPRAVLAISRAARAAEIDRLDVLAAAIQLRVRARGSAANREWALPDERSR